ncbi:MAG: hypothetical protein Q9159_002345 [Coniocarpon cinnabarinum]
MATSMFTNKRQAIALTRKHHVSAHQDVQNLCRDGKDSRSIFKWASICSTLFAIDERHALVLGKGHAAKNSRQPHPLHSTYRHILNVGFAKDEKIEEGFERMVTVIVEESVLIRKQQEEVERRAD